MIDVVGVAPLAELAELLHNSYCEVPETHQQLGPLFLKLLKILNLIGNLSQLLEHGVPLTDQARNIVLNLGKLVYIPKIFLKVRYQVLLLCLGLGIIHQLLNCIVDVELLTPREPLSLPVTLNHSNKSSEFSRLAQTVYFLALILLDLLKVPINHSDTTFRRLHSFPVRKIIIAKLNPLVIILILLIEHLHSIERVLPHHIYLREVESATLDARFVQVVKQWINLGIVRAS